MIAERCNVRGFQAVALCTGLVFLMTQTPAGAGEKGLLPPMRAAMEQSGIVGAAVIDAFEREPTVRVLIAFDVPAFSGPPMGCRDPDLQAAITTAADTLLLNLPAGEFDLFHRYQSLAAIAGEITVNGIFGVLENPSVMGIDLDHRGSATLAEAVPLVGLDRLHGDSPGTAGAGLTVAVIDTGVDTDHLDLLEALDDQPQICTCTPNCCPDELNVAEDDHGHGTNVAGIVASQGTIVPVPPAVGGAPGAGVLAVKALNSDGIFNSSDVLRGLDRICVGQPDVQVVNMSLGTFQLFEDACDTVDVTTECFAAAIGNLQREGVTVIAASGNDGSGTHMSLPGCIGAVISVGAVWDYDVGMVTINGCTDSTARDQVACFSNSNATTDLFAPGAPMTSTGMGGGFSIYYGTSQAAALVSACAAVLLQAWPGLTPEMIEAALKFSDMPVMDTTNGLYFPRLACEKALSTVILLDDFESGNLSLWPEVVGYPPRSASDSNR